MRRHAKKSRKKNAKRPAPQQNTVALGEPPNVLKVAARVATMQMQIARDRMAVGQAEINLNAARDKADRMVKSATDAVQRAKSQLTVDMLNHQEQSAQLEKASRIQIPVS